jgi:hypothetical protein
LLPLGLSGGNSGSRTSHNSSGKIARAMAFLPCSPSFRVDGNPALRLLLNKQKPFCQGFC